MPALTNSDTCIIKYLPFLAQSHRDTLLCLDVCTLYYLKGSFSDEVLRQNRFRLFRLVRNLSTLSTLFPSPRDIITRMKTSQHTTASQSPVPQGRWLAM
jgi:hypothetical protein